jgi:serine/threonine-protein kinase RIM15
MDTEGGDKGAMAPPPAPVVGLLRAEAAAPMERSLTAAMRAEREDLKEAAEQTLNVIMDLGLTGSVRWVSQSWSDVVGTKPEDITGLPIREIVLDDDKDIFVQAIESMQKDDTRSQIVRFTVALGPSSQLAQNLDVDTEEMAADVIRDENHYRYGTLALEAQGIMVYDRSSGGESHVS